MYSDVLPILSIVEPTTGNPVMPVRTSWTSARHRPTDFRLKAPPSKLWNWPMAPIIVGSPSADGHPMICKLPADYKESANFKGHGPTPAFGRCPADLYTISCRLMLPHIRLAHFPIFEVCNRHARFDQKSPDYAMTILCFIFLRILISEASAWRSG